MSEIENLTAQLEKVSKQLDNTASSADVKSLMEKQEQLAKQIADLEQKSVKPANSGKDSPLSLGERFTKSEAYTKFLDTNARTEITLETRGDPMLTGTAAPGVIVPYYKPGIVEQATRPLTIEALFTNIPISTNSFVYQREEPASLKAAITKEGAEYPESSVKLSSKQGNIYDVAHSARVSRQLIADLPAFSAFLNKRMAYGVNRAVEDELVKGDGSDLHLAGLLHEGNYVPHGAKQAAFGTATPNLTDLLFFASTKVAVAGGYVNCYLVNPMDWFKLSILKDSTGQYLVDTAKDSGISYLRGIPVVQSQAIPEGKFLAIDTVQYGTIYNREELTIELFKEDRDNAVRGLITVVATRRLGFAAENPAMACGGDLILPTA